LGHRIDTPKSFFLHANGPIAQSRLERTPDKREVVGSTPTRPTTGIED
jgi:hypothetical protein